MRPTPLTGALAAAALLGLVLTGCSSATPKGKGETAYVADATVQVALNADPGNLNPLTHLLFATNVYGGYVYDTIVALDENGEVVSNLSDTWEFDGTTATFHFPEGITFSDGTALTPEVIARNLEWHQNPENHSVRLGFGLPGEPYTVSHDDAAGTVTVTLGSPNSTFLAMLHELPIVAPQALDDPSLIEQSSLGTGPFVLVKQTPGSEYVLERRDGYEWGAGGAASDAEGFPASVVLRVVVDESTLATMLSTGELNAGDLTDPAALERVGDADRNETPIGEGQFFVNHAEGRPGADVDFRRALAQSVDIDGMVAVGTEGTGSRLTATTVAKPTMCSDNDSVAAGAPDYDVDAANAALDKLGYAKGADGVRRNASGDPVVVRVLGLTDGTVPQQSAMEYMTDGWREELGLSVDLVSADSATQFGKMFGGGDWDVAPITLNFGVPSQMMPFLDGVSNFAQIDNSGYRDGAARALAETDTGASCALWEDAEAALFRDGDIIGAYQSTRVGVLNGVESDGIMTPELLRVIAGG